MARVTVTNIDIGDAATVTAPNATQTSWNAQTADIDEQNLRDEGLHRRSLLTRALTPTNGRATLSLAGPTSNAAAGVDTLAVMAGPTNVVWGPIDNTAAGDQVIVRVSFDYEIATTTAELQVKLGYGTAIGGPFTALDDPTRRRFQFKADLAGRAGPVAHTGSCTIAHRFTASTSATMYFALLYQLTAGTVALDELRASARVYAK